MDASELKDGLLPTLAVATDDLLGRLRLVDDKSLRVPSALFGWTRGHVLAHVAQTGDALARLLISARTGVEVAAYDSQQARDAGIAAWADRDASALSAEVARSAEHFQIQVSAMPAHAWTTEVSVLGGTPFPAAQVLVRRLCEVVLHHTDLAVGYEPADWPAAFVSLDVPEPMHSQRLERQQRQRIDA
jgi:maleylpyruvate isomerase